MEASGDPRYESAEARLALFDFAFENAPIGIAVLDTAGRIIRGNEAFARLAGIPSDKIAGVSFADFTHPEDLEADLALFRDILAGAREGYTIEKRYLRRDATIVHVLIHVAAMRAPSGEVIRVISQIEDITVHKEHERQLEEKAAQLELAMDVIRGGFWHMDVATGCFETSDRLAQFIGGPSAARLDLAGYLEKVNAEDAHAADLTELVTGAVDHSVAQYRLTTVLGERWMRCDRRLLRGPDGHPRRIVGVAIDFTEEQHRLQESERHSETDALTGLINRRGLVRRYEEMKSGDGWAVLVMDLDGFKQINDAYGHPVGDIVLKETASRIGSLVREDDLACRLGGDEFLLVVGGPRRAGEEVARRVVEAMQRPVVAAGRKIEVGATVGGVWTASKADIDLLVGEADRHLYESKTAGKNRWSLGVLGG